LTLSIKKDILISYLANSNTLLLCITVGLLAKYTLYINLLINIIMNDKNKTHIFEAKYNREVKLLKKEDRYYDDWFIYL
jgi:hypothetical protein